ncbi:Intracellular chorismate mutase [Micromonospora sp. MH33]|uniref:chorismate mutase n=1 Tax=Micromonospora sp. MH33 TaxID=1945509 RepID=UPI000D14A766|nr:chorismate mutase [Micromonospora sp. MH33]PSK63996.1 Intracellular chorismate mutase [Micromonospora sp. MH33]
MVDETTGTPTRPADGRPPEISSMRRRIDEIDATIIGLWQERAGLSRQIGRLRLASGGTRLVLSREQEILARFRAGIGDEGTQLALLVLRAGRGPL